MSDIGDDAGEDVIVAARRRRLWPRVLGFVLLAIVAALAVVVGSPGTELEFAL